MGAAFSIPLRASKLSMLLVIAHSAVAPSLALCAGLPADDPPSAVPKFMHAPEPTSQVAVIAAASVSARSVLDRVRPAIIQIKGFFDSNSAQAFHGTGFAVTDGGVFMTNYHVVSQRVQQPAKYRLEYRTVEGKTGAIKVLAVDVRHDLALVRAEGYAPAPLMLEPTLPAKGERAYSIGFPLDVGLTITEGVSNGKVEESFEPRIHYSGALNGGMSGGPALNGAGEVIGVNVSGYRFQQLVSFLVPAAHAMALRDRARDQDIDAQGLKQDILAQLHSHSAALLKAIDAPLQTQTVGGYALPGKFAPFIDCAAPGDSASDQPVRTVHISCSAKAGLFLQPDLSSGDINFQHSILSTEKLDSWRFANRLSAQTSTSGRSGSPRHVGPFACNQKIVGLKGFDASLLVCARAYKRLEGLYDFTVRVSSLNGTTQGFTSKLNMYGLEFATGMTFIERFVDVMEWKP